MWQFLLILITVSMPSLTTGIPLSCDTSRGFVVCKDYSGAVSAVFQLVEGKSLKMNKNRISSIDSGAFRNLADLRSLKIGPKHYGQPCTPSIINITPESFQGLISVEAVILKCVKLQGAPGPFKKFDSLKRLSLIGNQFTEFPQELCADIPSLRELVVTDQRIRSLSSTSFLNITEGLQTLSVISSELESIEARSFKRFHHLNSLRLMENYLKIIGPDMFDGLDKLTILQLSRNQLRTIEPGTFAGLKHLREIILQANCLESLPDGIFNGLEDLNSLVLDGNPISTLSYNSFNGLQHLEELSLGFNGTAQIEPNTFRDLNVTELGLNANELDFLEAETFDGLTTEFLYFIRNNTINFKRNLFRGLKVGAVYIFEENMTKIDSNSWGLGKHVPINSVKLRKNSTSEWILTPYEI